MIWPLYIGLELIGRARGSNKPRPPRLTVHVGKFDEQISLHVYKIYLDRGLELILNDNIMYLLRHC